MFGSGSFNFCTKLLTKAVTQLEFFNPNKSHGKFGALVQLEAKPDKKHEVEAFLKSAFPLNQAQADTVSWYAVLVCCVTPVTRVCLFPA